jgi:xanthine dehydrogenase YagS FAD-binding subunit
MNRFEYASPQSVDQAIASMNDGAAFKAGGIDLLDRMKEGVVRPSRLVDLHGIKDLRGIKLDDKQLTIGATTTLAELAANGAVREQLAALAQAASSAANPQIRNVATCGGNLLQRPRCWYFRTAEFKCLKKGGATCFAQKGENKYHAIFGGGPSYIVHPSTLATALVALDGRIKTNKRELALKDFFTLPSADYEKENVLADDEIITHILVPRPAPGTRTHFLSIKERQVYDWPLAEVAVALRAEGGKCKAVSIVLGAAAPIPWRAKKAELALIGKSITGETARDAGRAAVDGAKPLAQNGYKIPLFEATVARAIMNTGRS